MGREIHIEELRQHLSQAKDRLAHEKTDILNLHPLPDTFNREEYAFAYVRAERLGMRAINRRLAEIDWLPMQLDAKSEVMTENRSSMKRWLTSAFMRKPDAEEFGNDFMHSLARCGLALGWDNPGFIKLSARIANLFRDLSCLIGTIYYCTWLTENNVESIPLSSPEDINKTAEEIAVMMQSSEVYKFMRAAEQDDAKESKRKKASGAKGVAAKKQRPVLRVIENKNYFDSFAPEPAPAV